MNPTAAILMYSGAQNPEKELTDQEITDIRALVAGLDMPYPGQAHGHLGFSGYAASFQDMHVIASLYGHIRIFDAQGQEKAYSDTTGVLAYLCKIMTPVMIKHQEDAKKQMDDYIASTFKWDPPPWEPNF